MQRDVRKRTGLKTDLNNMHTLVPFLGVFFTVTVCCLLCALCGASSSTSGLSSITSRHFTDRQKLQNISKSSKKNPLSPKGIRCDLYCCNCNGKKARCTGQDGRKLHYLPQLPDDIRDFRMFHSNFSHLTRTMMLNLSNFELIVMTLTDNQIHHIDSDTFADFPQIEFLDLSSNPILISELYAALKGMSSVKLSTLCLADMGYSSLPDTFFDIYFNRTFTKVDLQQNKFKVFKSALFQPFLLTDIVNMADNEITDVNISVRVNIKNLILKDNRFEEFPDLSLLMSQTKGEKKCKEAFYYLRTIVISGNPLRRIDPHLLRGDCLPKLRRLDIRLSTLLRTLENQFIADLPALETLIVNDMKMLDRYEPYAFNSSSLRTLQLNRNRRLDRETMVIPEMFRHCPNLEKLIIIDTKLDMDMKEMFAFLSPLRSVRDLNLQKIRQGSIPPDLLWRLTNLTRLIFTGGNLNSYTLGQALEKVTSIEWLNVQGNGITVVNESTLPWPFRRNLKGIDLSQNPFSCTCQMLWFRKWVDDVQKNGSVRVQNFRSRQYRCRTPADMTGTPLHQFRPTAESCAVKNPFVVVGLVSAGVLAGVIITLSLVYRYRWHLRYHVYRLRRRREYSQIPGGLLSENGEVQMFTYDAYLAHSSKDVDWIFQTLLPIVEGEQGLKVYVEERDSIPGSILVDNITKYMDESARVMLLISDHYNQDGWRQGEFEHILFATFEQHKDIIVLLLGDVEAGQMTRDMRRMLTRGTFLQWGLSEDAQKAFSNGLRVALKTQDVNFQTFC